MRFSKNPSFPPLISFRKSLKFFFDFFVRFFAYIFDGAVPWMFFCDLDVISRENNVYFGRINFTEQNW